MDLLPNALSFRVITTIEVESESAIPEAFTGRVRFKLDDVLVYVAWYTEGLLDSPSRRMPAYVRYRADGRVKYEMYYRRGMLHDPSETQPAVRGYFANGRVHYEERFWNGRRHDGPHDAAAVRKWRPDGSLRRELHSRYGKPMPGRPPANYGACTG